ncbi:MAG TPA: serine/threonine-protein kinase, partial [Ktedonobacteraceae bacterium]|nr:serine/threonine-protein kinase [Ktedonobacteraceae bacterium]
LSHPNLPCIYAQFTEMGRWYLVMDFIEGETLEDYLRKTPGGYLPLAEALAIGVQLSTVLDYLHTRHPPVIFRDLKPANVMRTPAGHLYLIDFGIARHFKPGQPTDTIALGSPGYAAREQYAKLQSQTTPRSDIYSLGATLHQLLTGDDPSLMPFQFARMRSQPVPASLESLIMRMVELDAHKRPASIALVKQELQRLADQQTQSPVPISMPASQLFRPVTSPLSAAPVKYVKTSPRTARTLRTYHGHSREVYALDWSPDGKLIASGGKDETAQVWDATSGRRILTYFGHSHWFGNGLVQAVMWSPDGNHIASGSWDKTVRVWHAATGNTVSTYRSYYELVEAVAWSPDGKYIASGNRNGTVHIWDVSSGKNVRTFHGHYSKGLNVDVVSVAWSPDSKRVASASWDRTVQVWNALKQSKRNDYLVFRGHAHEVNALAWSPDGTRIASGGRDNLIKVWDSSSGGLILSYRGHTAYVVSVAWSPDGTHLASAGADKSIQVWDAATGNLVCTYSGHSNRVNAVAWSPDGTRIASASNDHTVQVWQAP